MGPGCATHLCDHCSPPPGPCRRWAPDAFCCRRCSGPASLCYPGGSGGVLGFTGLSGCPGRGSIHREGRAFLRTKVKGQERKKGPKKWTSFLPIFFLLSESALSFLSLPLAGWKQDCQIREKRKSKTEHKTRRTVLKVKTSYTKDHVVNLFSIYAILFYKKNFMFCQVRNQGPRT